MSTTAKRHYDVQPVQGRTYTPWGLAGDKPKEAPQPKWIAKL